MAKVFLTGSSDGIGLAAARLLVEQGHQVTLHARNAERAKQAQEAVPKAAGVLIGDLSSIEDTKSLAQSANQAGPWDAVVHNAGIGLSNDTRTKEGYATTWAVNVLGPYLLTSLMHKPKRLLYLSSGLHYSGSTNLDDVAWIERRQISTSQAYNDTKLQDVILANAIARHWPDVQSCSMDPGWVQTKMGGSSAMLKVEAPAKAIAAYVAGTHTVGAKTGLYFSPAGIKDPVAMTKDVKAQDRLLETCEKLSGVELPK